MTSLCIGLIKDKYQRMTTMISDHWSPLQQDSGQHENGARLQRLPLCSPITLGSRGSNKAGWGKDLENILLMKKDHLDLVLLLLRAADDPLVGLLPPPPVLLHQVADWCNIRDTTIHTSNTMTPLIPAPCGWPPWWRTGRWGPAPPSSSGPARKAGSPAPSLPLTLT